MVDSHKEKPTSNRAVVWTAANEVEIKDVGYPKMQSPSGEPLHNAAVIKVLLTAICGSDLHAYKGRTSAKPGSLVFGHEMTGEIVEVGSAVDPKTVKVGDWVSIPFNISCAHCENCKNKNFAWCQKSGGLGGIYVSCNCFATASCVRRVLMLTCTTSAFISQGYAAGGGWQGGQAQYALVPWIEANALVLPESIKQNPQKLMDVVSDEHRHCSDINGEQHC